MLKRWIDFQTTEHNWLIDLEFLLSNWDCGFGSTCKGINTDKPEFGCCANGAYLSEEDMTLLNEKVPLLTQWQHRRENYVETLFTEQDGENGHSVVEEHKTATIDPNDDMSGCVFAHDADSPYGIGCSLHKEAMIRGEDYRDWKPYICWSLPLWVDYLEEIDYRILRMFYWDEEQYPWYCGQDEVTWVAEKPLYQTLDKELKKMLVEEYKDPEAYEIVKGICDQAFAQSAQWRGDKPMIKPVPVTLRGNEQ